MLHDLVIRDGTLVTASEIIQADLGIQNGKIVAIGQGLQGKEALSARGLLVVPGAIDTHVHLEMPTPATVSSDDWRSGTVAAAHGGTTTVIDFVEPEAGQSLLAALQQRRAQAEGRAAIDYSLHMTLSQTDEETLAEIPKVIKEGVFSFKVYTVYEGLRLDDRGMVQALATVSQYGGLVIAHAENEAIVRHATQALLRAGKTGPESHPLSRPAVAEGEAVERMLALAEYTHAPILIVHISTRRGAEAVGRARRRGQTAFGETCPQYLLLDDTAYSQPDFEGAKFVCAPPLRKPEDNQFLWKALAEGEVQTVGTDHCPFFFVGQKELGREDFTKIPGGIPGIEARFALLYTFGVRAGRISLNRWVEACCTAPARIFGLYPRKGALLPGADADLVLFDPERAVTLTADFLHENVDYTPYEGLKLQGYPVLTLLRGEVLVREGEFVGTQGKGQFLKRTTKKW